MQLPYLLAWATSAAGLVLSCSPTTGNSGPQPYPNTTQITYYQGRASTAGSALTAAKFPIQGTGTSACGIAVSTSTLHAHDCQLFRTAGVAIAASAQGNCTLTLYTGTRTCTGEEKMVVPVVKGVGETCVGTGVLDGGKFQQVSGVWKCE